MHVITIAYVIDSIETPSAGTEQQLLMLMRGIDRGCFRPVLVCLRGSDWLRTQSFDFPVEVIGLGRLLSPQLARGFHRFAALHRKHRFDIVQTFFVDANIFGTVAARLAGVRHVISSRRNAGYWQTPLHRWILRRLRVWTRHYLCNSQAVRAQTIETEGVDPSRVAVIYNGLDLDRFAQISEEMRTHQRAAWGIKPDEVLVGAVANLRPVKNLEALIEAIAHLAEEFPRLKGVVVGEGDQREPLQKPIDDRNLTNRFLLAGSCQDIVPCLAAFDVAVLTSHSEGFSNALIEYMAAGLPVAASRVGGNAEAIEDGRTGVLFDLDDSSALSTAIRTLLTNPTRAADLGKAARSAAHGLYDEEVCLRRHEEYYGRICDAE